MQSVKTAEVRGDSARERPNLDRQYGKIGISAVAAAVRFQSKPRKPTYVPVYTQRDD